MSFGAASPPRGRRAPSASSCVCGSGAAFGACCGPILDGADAVTAQALMRSRYAAFALGDAAYLLASWHPATRPERLDLDPQLDWCGLEIVAIQSGEDADTSGVVAFRASWRDRSSGERGTLDETSRFRRLGGRWMYVDGVVAARSA